jgi:hypothetical protein
LFFEIDAATPQEFLTANQQKLLMTKEGTLESQWEKENWITAAGKHWYLHASSLQVRYEL